jgi:hypothetical protein
VSAAENKAKPCDYCGRRGEMKATASRGDGHQYETFLFCHSNERSCYNAARGRYFEECSCTKQYFRRVDQLDWDWTLTRRDPECQLHKNDVLL